MSSKDMFLFDRFMYSYFESKSSKQGIFDQGRKGLQLIGFMNRQFARRDRAQLLPGERRYCRESQQQNLLISEASRMSAAQLQPV